MTDTPITSNSWFVRSWSRVRSAFHRASERSTAVSIAVLFLRANAPDEDSDTEEAQSSASAVKDGESTAEPTSGPSETQPSRLTRGSWLYRFIHGVQDALAGSVCYGVLTGREEPREIVIDLRKPQLVATLRRLGTWGYETVVGLSSTSGVAGVIYRGWERIREQPIRLVSIGVLALTLLVLVGDAVAGTAVGPSTFVLIGVLIVAARGTQKTHSWDQLATTRWVRNRLVSQRAPAPSESTAAEDDRDE